MDVTRTVGWFTATYPVVVACSSNLQQQLIEAKEALHSVPNKGIGYGILRYMAGRPYKARPWLSFNYLGDFGDGAATHSGEQLFNYSTLNRGVEVDGARARDVLLDVTGLMAESCLRVNIGYSRAQFDEVRMQELTDAYRRQLETLVNWLSQQKHQRLTPSDLTYQSLSLAELQALEAGGPVEDVYELSPLQQGLYYHWVSAKKAAAYFMQTNCTIKGALNVTLLNDAYNRLVQRHSILRSHFAEQAGVLLQVVKKEVAAAIEYVDVSESADVQEAVAAYKAADRLRGFDLSAGSQMRLAVLHTGNETFEFVWSHHHILMDGWCGGILIKEFFTIYDSLLANREPVLPAVNGYAAYIKWLRTVDKNASLAYWKEYLHGYVNSNRLWEPARELTAGRKPYQPIKRKFELPLQLSTAVKTLVASLGVTESSFVQVIWSLLVGAHTNSNDVVFGSVVSGRPAELKGVEEMIGLFSNTVPVRLQWNNELTVEDLLKQAQQQWIAGSKHHYVQLADVQAQSALGRELFNQVMVTENFPVQEMLEQSTEGSGSLSFLASDVFDQTNYDFTLTVRPGGERLELCIDCDANLYDAAQMATMEQHFLQLVQQAVAQPGATIGALQLLNEEERRQLLHSFNDTAVNYDPAETLVSLFDKQVLATPTATAVVFEANSLSYAQLNEQANRLAVHLQQEYDVAAGKLVSIMMRRSHHLLVAILAVLKAGAAYVPVDVEHPRNRKEFMMADSASPLVLTESEYMFELDYFSGQVFALDVQLDALPPAPAAWKANVQPASLAYVIYTSGSTGKPKGVMIEHGAIANTIQSQCEIFDVRPGFNHLQFASASFDASVSEMFVALCSGGTLCIIGDAARKDAAQLLQFINDHAVGIATIPPAYMQLLEAADLKTLKRLVTAGEAVAKSRVENFADYGDYYNAYGPTETSICATIFKNPKGHSLPHARLPIGKPIANTSVYILNEHNQLCPPGAPGEICVSGRGLASGYWNQPALTSEKFVDNPFVAGTRMYKTGDLGRWLPSGEIEFIGRKDAQVKIRGHRIELGEVEAVLQLHPQVSQAVAQVCEVAGTQQLVAYVVSTPTIDAASLRGHVANWLPAYMLPDHFITIPALPLNTSGKIDKAALPLPEGMGDAGEYLAPRTATEQSLAVIWSEVLGIEQEKIGVRDNFFNLGGHSLKVIQLMARVRKQFEVNPGIDALFKNPTIEFLSGEIEKTQLVNAGSPQFENADNIENFQV
jgi:amino acid adenylation domain-containing protein/non-ribosomal peptide synthase protein (TIGR01720 family)